MNPGTVSLTAGFILILAHTKCEKDNIYHKSNKQQPFSVRDFGSFLLPLYKKMGPKNINPYHQRTRTNITVKRKFSALLIWDEFIFSVIARGKLHVPLDVGAFT